MLLNLWNRINGLQRKAESKFRLFRLALVIPCGLFGALVWLAVHNWSFHSPEWIICFAGYPMLLVWFAANLYLYRHDNTGGI